jgi:hypothetical protein
MPRATPSKPSPSSPPPPSASSASRSLAQDMPTVLDTRRFAFLGVEQIGQRTVQQVLITDSTEHEWLAEFQLEQMKSGDWRVKGCILQSTPGQQA